MAEEPPHASPGPEPADGHWYLDFAGQRRTLPAGNLVIGRRPSPGAEAAALPVSDSTVSRDHARLRLAEGRLTLTDLDSSNGTFVNDRRVRGVVELSPGDRVRLGRVRLQVGRASLDDTGVLRLPVAGQTASGRRFCPSCGAQVGGETAACPHCGEDLTQERPLSRSEAIAMSEVMPVGEALAQPPRFRERTSPVSWERSASQVASGAPRSLDDTTGVDIPAPVADEEEGLAAVEAEAGRDPAEARPLFLPAAGFLRRAGAALADSVGVLAAGVAGAVVRLYVGPTASTAEPFLWAGVGTAAAVWALVSVVGWWRWGTTPGKRLLRLWVCDLDGRPGLSPGRSLARFAGYSLSLLTLGYGFFRAGMSADGRALHDLLAGTYVAHPSRDVLLAEGRGRRRRFRRRQRRTVT